MNSLSSMQCSVLQLKFNEISPLRANKISSQNNEITTTIIGAITVIRSGTLKLNIYRTCIVTRWNDNLRNVCTTSNTRFWS